MRTGVHPWPAGYSFVSGDQHRNAIFAQGIGPYFFMSIEDAVVGQTGFVTIAFPLIMDDFLRLFCLIAESEFNPEWRASLEPCRLHGQELIHNKSARARECLIFPKLRYC